MMADMAMKIEAGRALTYAAAKDIDMGGGDPKITAGRSRHFPVMIFP